MIWHSGTQHKLVHDPNPSASEEGDTHPNGFLCHRSILLLGHFCLSARRSTRGGSLPSPDLRSPSPMGRGGMHLPPWGSREGVASIIGDCHLGIRSSSLRPRYRSARHDTEYQSRLADSRYAMLNGNSITMPSTHLVRMEKQLL